MNQEIYEFFQNYDFDSDYLTDVKYEIGNEMFNKYFMETPFNLSICKALQKENVEDVKKILILFQRSSWDDELLFRFMDYCGEKNIQSDVPLSVEYLISIL